MLALSGWRWLAAGKYVLISILGFLSYCLKVCNYTIGLSLIARDDDDDDADFAGLLASAQCKCMKTRLQCTVVGFVRGRPFKLIFLTFIYNDINQFGI